MSDEEQIPYDDPGLREAFRRGWRVRLRERPPAGMAPLGLPPTALRGPFGDDIPLGFGEGAEHLRKSRPEAVEVLNCSVTETKRTPFGSRVPSRTVRRSFRDQGSRSAL